MSAKILVIDDDQINTRLLQNQLTAKAYDVRTASDGKSGLEAVQAGLPDLIILDVEMPGMDGYSFLKELHKTPEYKKIPVVMLTAYEEVQSIFQFQGVRGYLVKPVKFDQLFAKIDECLKG